MPLVYCRIRTILHIYPRQSVPKTDCQLSRRSILDSLGLLKIRTPVANTGKLRSIGQVPVVPIRFKTFCYDDLYRLFYFNHILYKDTINFTSLKLDFINESLMKIQKAYEFLENYFLRNLTGFIFFIIMYLLLGITKTCLFIVLILLLYV